MEKNWFVLRTSATDLLPVRDFLQDSGLELFLPMRVVERDGVSKLVPISNNLLLVFAEKSQLDRLKSSPEAKSAKYTMADNGSPLVLPDDEVRNFIMVASQLDKGVTFLNPNRDEFKRGPMVRVTEGDFVGVCGEYLRVRGNRCVVVRFRDYAVVATGFVKPEFTKPLDEAL